MNKTVKRVLLIILAVILFIALIIGLYYFIQKKNNNLDIDISAANGNDIIANQVIIDEAIKNYINDESIKIDDPEVLVNPYKISPLTALIIFHTNNDVSYSVYLNNQLLTKTEYSKQHSIPIYGLNVKKENIVKLQGSDNSSKELTIETSNDNYSVIVDTNNVSNDNYYFITSIDDPRSYAINNKGETVWFLNLAGGQDMEFLSNGHMLINNGSSTGLNSYSGFYEVDYFGKIYKSYSLKNNYHHEVNELSNGDLIVAGDKTDSKFSESYIYTVSKDSGEEIQSLDLYDVFANVDEAFTKSLGSFDMINNSIDYNESSKDLILSLRGLNAVMSINYETKQINWILGDQKNFSQNFSKYLLKSSDNSRLPLGQHTAFITSEGYLGLLNNDYDVTNTDKISLKEYTSNYSSATYYQIDKSNMTYKSVWNYIDQDHVFNYALSSFNISKDKHKIINFGWSFDSKLYQRGASIYDETGESYSRIVDLDENNNIVFRAKTASNNYRVFKNKFYGEKTDNYIPTDITIFNTYDVTVFEEVPTLSIQNKLSEAEDEGDEVTFNNDNIDINASFDTLEDVKIVFRSDAISYIYKYKPANQTTNSRVNIKIKGKYDIYIVVDDVYYKTNSKLDTDNKTIIFNN